MAQKFFMESTVEHQNQRFEAGNVYTADQQTTEMLIKNGQAVPVQFPALDAVEYSVNTLLEKYKRDYENVKNHPRYAANEPERQYQLSLLDEQLENDMAALREKYYTELKTLEAETARKALEIEMPNDEKVNSFVDMTVSDITHRDDLVTTLELLEMKVNAFTDEQKVSLLRRFGDISAAAKEKATISNKDRVNRILSDIYDGLKKANKVSSVDATLKQLRAMRKYNPLAAYDTFKIVNKRRGGGN
jgi:hypothetical protein